MDSTPYFFLLDPDCSLTPTLTVTGLPGFANHDTTGQFFSVPSTTDLGLIGSYPVTIKSEITFFSDYTKTTQTTLTAEYTFTIYMEPCIIVDYFDSITVPTLTYFIGDTTLTDGFYEFTQDLACGYPETITVSNLPSFATHRSASADFQIPATSDLDLIGVYTVNIKAEICVPDDYTQGSCTPVVVQYDFEILVEPCIITSFDPTPELFDMIYSVREPALVNGPYGFT